MNDCQAADLHDLLPVYAHGTLTGADRARVDGHLAGCAECRRELALVRAVRAAAPQPRLPDVARIVAALPRPAGRGSGDIEGVLPLSTDSSRARRAFPWRRVTAVAAVLVGVVGIGVLGRLPAGGRNEPAMMDDPRGSTATEPTASATATAAEPALASRSDTPSTSRPDRRSAPARVADAVGALGGVASGATVDELEALMGGLDSLSGIPDVESFEGERSTQDGGRSQ